MRKLLNKKGFTLIELMVVIVIVGILAAVAIPKFTMASHKAKLSEFPTVLTSIYTAEGAYFNEAGQYGAAANNANAQWTIMGLENPNTGSKWFQYDVTQAGGTSTFVATALTTEAIGAVPINSAATIDHTQAKLQADAYDSYVSNWE